MTKAPTRGRQTATLALQTIGLGIDAYTACKVRSTNKHMEAMASEVVTLNATASEAAILASKQLDLIRRMEERSAAESQRGALNRAVKHLIYEVRKELKQAIADENILSRFVRLYSLQQMVDDSNLNVSMLADIADKEQLDKTLHALSRLFEDALKRVGKTDRKQLHRFFELVRTGNQLATASAELIQNRTQTEASLMDLETTPPPKRTGIGWTSGICLFLGLGWIIGGLGTDADAYTTSDSLPPVAMLLLGSLAVIGGLVAFFWFVQVGKRRVKTTDAHKEHLQHILRNEQQLQMQQDRWLADVDRLAAQYPCFREPLNSALIPA